MWCNEELTSLIQTIVPALNVEIISSDIIGHLLELTKDPIPNIRFNVAKALEVTATSFGSTPEGRAFIQEQIAPILHTLKNDVDVDVRYFASHALQKTL